MISGGKWWQGHALALGDARACTRGRERMRAGLVDR